MFSIDLDQLEFSQIVSFLETGVREGIALEFKKDFPNHLEKTLASFANTYGGFLLIGVDETRVGAASLPILGVELRPGLRERVLQKALEAVYPPLLPEVRVYEFSSAPGLAEADRALVVIKVIESDEAPHAVDNRTVVYLRNDNVSTRFTRTASLAEIEWLRNRRAASRELRELLFRKAAERTETVRAHRRARNKTEQYWREGTMTFKVSPAFPREPLLGTRAWAAIVEKSRVNVNTAPRTLPSGSLQRIAGGVIYNGEYGSSEYQETGVIVHEFDYWWDYLAFGVSQSMRQLYPSTTAAMMTSVLENASKLYQSVGYAGLVDLEFVATGLKDAAFFDPQRMLVDVPKLLESEIKITRRFSAAEMHDSTQKIAIEGQRELYWAFGFDAPDTWIKSDFHIC